MGQRYDGSLIFYTIDGRKSGHSIGATMDQVARRLVELGCTTALCLDGGGSTTLAVTQPTDTAAELKLVEEQTNREIARRLGMNESTVAVRVMRGRTMLKERLEKEGYAYDAV